MVKAGNEIVQAFPIHAGTYVGIPNAYTSGGKILHAAEDGSITFDFGTAGSVTVDAVAGQDIAIDRNVQAITATMTCWIS